MGQNIIHEIKNRKLDWEIDNLSSRPCQIEGVNNIIIDAAKYEFGELHHNYDYIIHLLALSNDKYCADFELANQINIEFTKKLLDFAQEQSNLSKFVHLSSIIIYDNSNKSPVKETDKLFLNYTTYSFTKGVSEFYADFYRQKYNLPLIIFRLSNIYGPYQEVKDSPFLVPSKIYQALQEGKIEVFNLAPRRDWIYSGDAATAIVKSLDSKLSGTYNLASGKGVSVEEIISSIARKINVTYASLDRPTTGPLDFYCDIAKIQKELGWSPKVSLTEGIRSTIKYFKDEISK